MAASKKITWNPADPRECERAQSEFGRVRDEGFVAYRRGASGVREQAREFDPSAGELVMVRPWREADMARHDQAAAACSLPRRLMRQQWKHRCRRLHEARLDGDAEVMRMFLAELDTEQRIALERQWFPITGSCGGRYLFGAGLFRTDTHPSMALCLHVAGESVSDWLLATLLLLRSDERHLLRLAYAEPVTDTIQHEITYELALHQRLDRSLDRALEVAATSVERATRLADLAVAAFANASDHTHQEKP